MYSSPIDLMYLTLYSILQFTPPLCIVHLLMYVLSLQTFTEESEALPSYHTVSHIKNTDYEEEDSESLIDLNFHEDLVSQPYLSLGLTPLSQLSPDPIGSSGPGGDFGFFPSMLPPVSPMTSVINATSGISVDNAPQMDQPLELVMPDAMPAFTIPPDPRRAARRGRVDTRGEGMISAFSNSRLEPVAEHSSLETDDISAYSASRTTSNSHDNSLKVNNTTNLIDLKSDSSIIDDGNVLVFPSANGSPPVKLPMNQHVQRKPTREQYDYPWLSTDSSPKHQSNGAPSSKYTDPYLLPHDDFQPSRLLDQRELVRQKRQQARQEAIAKQREQLLAANMEEERRKFQRQWDLQQKITRQHGNVLQQAAMFDAREELAHEGTALLSRGTPGMQTPPTARYTPTKFSPQHKPRHHQDIPLGVVRSRIDTDPEDLSHVTDYTTVL